MIQDWFFKILTSIQLSEEAKQRLFPVAFLGTCFLKKRVSKKQGWPSGWPSRGQQEQHKPSSSASAQHPAWRRNRSFLGNPRQVFLEMLICILSRFQGKFQRALNCPWTETKWLLFYFFLQAGGTKQQCYLLVVNSHQLFCPLPQLETPLFIVTQWNISGAARVLGYTGKGEIKQAINTLLRFLFLWLFCSLETKKASAVPSASWRQAKTWRHTHALSPSPPSFKFLTRFIFFFPPKLPKQLSGFPSGDE